jgi:protein tyrosine phosphatase (PTP) superfamily phosphohydrolase (DUF442 family)
MVYFNDFTWVGEGGVSRNPESVMTDRDHNPFYRKRWPVVAAFLYLWVTVGFFIGTGVLIGPARWVTQGMEHAGFAQKAQDHAMQAVMLVFVFGSAAVSLWLLRRVLHGTRRVKLGIPAVATIAAMASLWGWMNPGRMFATAAGGLDHSSLATASGAHFIFGAYPDENMLRDLKRQGVTAVISLQHPAVLPFEPASIQEEKRAAKEVGIEFIHAPMLPWVSDNREALEKVRRIAHEGHGVYYVHCGLGRDRTNVVRRMLEADGVKTVAHGSIGHALTFEQRLRMPSGRAFERGSVRRLEPGVYLTPFPNVAEFNGYFEGGQVKTVVFLLDPNDPAQKAGLAQGQRVLATAGVQTYSRPLMGRDLPTAKEIAAWARTLPRPLAVVAPATPFANGDRYPGTQAAAAFLDAYQALAGAPAVEFVPQAPAR